MCSTSTSCVSGLFQPHPTQGEPLRLGEVEATEANIFQSRQHHHQFFPSHRSTTAGMSEVSLHVKTDRQGLPWASSLPGRGRYPEKVKEETFKMHINENKISCFRGSHLPGHENPQVAYGERTSCEEELGPPINRQQGTETCYQPCELGSGSSNPR